jgi:Uma2 family endonuclease
MTAAARRLEAVYYPETDHMGEDALQRFIAEFLRPLVAMWLAMCGRRCFVGADQFIYLVEGDTRQRVAPDVYVLPGAAPDAAPPCWKLWELSAPPAFALEIVSKNHQKDYETLPPLYGKMGARELVVFDPRVTARSRVRIRWHVYRRLGRSGWRLVERSNEDRVYSRELGCWLRAVGDGPRLRLRLATDTRGDVLLPTEAEKARAALTIAEAQAGAERAARQRAEEEARTEALRAQSEAQRAESEAQRAESEALRAEQEALRATREVTAREEAEQELAQLRAELARLRSDPKRSR